MTAHSGSVLWITGLSGAGKTTIARELCGMLRGEGLSPVHVDGDAVREIVGDDLGHGESDRVKNAYRISRLCRFLHDQGSLVICSTMSLYPEIWAWNRANISGYFEVYLKVSKETVTARDPKGLYRRAKEGAEKNLVGFDIGFAEPKDAHLVLQNDDSSPAAAARAAERILTEWKR